MSGESVTPPPVADSRTGSDGVVYFSGIVGVDENWNAITDSPEAEIAAVFAGIDRRLAAQGLTRADILFARVYLADYALFDVMNDAWSEYFHNAEPPARATISVGLHPPFGFEIEVTVQGRPPGRPRP